MTYSRDRVTSWLRLCIALLIGMSTALHGADRTLTVTATPASPITGTSTVLTITGAIQPPESGLLWSMVSGPAAVTFGENDGLFPYTSVVAFSKAGTYQLRIAGSYFGLSFQGDITVVVNQTLSQVLVTGPTWGIKVGSTVSLTASARDQFNQAMTLPAGTWTCSAGSVTSSGVWTAPATAGTQTITRTANGVQGSYQANVVPPLVLTNPSAVLDANGKVVHLGVTVTGGDPVTHVFTWSVVQPAPAAVTFSIGGQYPDATLTRAGIYTFQVNVTTAGGDSATQSVAISVPQNPQRLEMDLKDACIGVGEQIPVQFRMMDQFDRALPGLPAAQVSLSGTGAATMNSATSLLSAGGAVGGPYTVTGTVGSYTVSHTFHVVLNGEKTVGNVPIGSSIHWTWPQYTTEPVVRPNNPYGGVLEFMIQHGDSYIWMPSWGTSGGESGTWQYSDQECSAQKYPGLYVWGSIQNTGANKSYAIRTWGGSKCRVPTFVKIDTPQVQLNMQSNPLIVPSIGPMDPGRVVMTISFNGDQCTVDGTPDYSAYPPPDDNSDLPDPLKDLYKEPEAAPPPNDSGDPIRYNSGEIELSATDLRSEAFGGWAITRTYSNIRPCEDGSLGLGWSTVQVPAVSRVSPSTYAVQFGAAVGVLFKKVGTDYQLVNQSYGSTLVESNGNFLYRDASGQEFAFHSLRGFAPAAQRGRLASMRDASGGIARVTYDGSGYVTAIEKSGVVGADTVTMRFRYVNATNGAVDAIYQEIVTQTAGGSVTVEPVRSVAYTYYSSATGQAGLAGQLKTVTIRDATGNPLETTHYRYWVNGPYPGGLQYVLNARTYARMVGQGLDPLTVDLSGYANQYFEYDYNRRVVKHTLRQPGTNASGTYLYAYFVKPGPDQANVWRIRTIETLPDGNTKRIYSNYLGLPLLNVATQVSNGAQWIDAYRYDEKGLLLLHATPAAVSGYDEALPDLVGLDGADAPHIRNDQGIIYGNAFYQSTSATDTTPGGVSGRLQHRFVKKGELGAPEYQNTMMYLKRIGR